GYDLVSRLYYQPSVTIEPIPDAPTRDDALAALESLKDLVYDFPFERIGLPDGTVITAEHHRATWLAGLLTAFAMHYITSPVPMTAIDGNVPGAGKGLLIDMIATALLGAPAPAMGAPKNMEELDKRISAKGKAAIQMLKVDNVKGQLGGDIWEALATTRRWNGRELGKSLDLTVRIDFPIFFSANGFQPVGDMPRRVLRCALQHPDESPEERTGFKYPEILDHIQQNRARYVRDVLVILRAYIAAGKPSQGVRLGSYEDWAKLVPSALVWLGEPDVTITRRYYTTTVSSDKSRLSALLTAWFANYGSKPTLARSVIEDVENAYEERTKDLADALARFAWGGKELTSKTLGSNLTQYKSRNIDGMRIASVYDKHAKVERWYVEKLGQASNAIPEPPPPVCAPELGDHITLALDQGCGFVDVMDTPGARDPATLVPFARAVLRPEQIAADENRAQAEANEIGVMLNGGDTGLPRECLHTLSTDETGTAAPLNGRGVRVSTLDFEAMSPEELDQWILNHHEAQSC
ncbi:MAG: hypothetical protein RL701_5876, partial [Pseudomonadota bacterium]